MVENKAGIATKNELFSHLEKIEDKGTTMETQKLNPINMYSRNKLDEYRDKNIESNKTITQYIIGEEGVDYMHATKSIIDTLSRHTLDILDEAYKNRQLNLDPGMPASQVETIKEWRDGLEQNEVII